MKEKFEGVIFDIDGTLTSTNELIFKSFNHIAKKYLDRSFTEKEIIALFGPTEDAILKELCGKNFEAARKDYYEFYKSHHHIANLYPGIKELLDYLKTKGVLLAVFTGKGRQASLITLEELSIINYFDIIVTGDDVANHKPSSEGIMKFVNEYNLKKDEILMIGDSVADVRASKEAGIRIASALWDSYAAEKVKYLGSDYYFNTVDELKEFLVTNT
ncbi:MAG: HAD family hydrolase [Bacteroidetes bacterium]|nr:HAD family hydrolase [Bacteroidota bacterium]